MPKDTAESFQLILTARCCQTRGCFPSRQFLHDNKPNWSNERLSNDLFFFFFFFEAASGRNLFKHGRSPEPVSALGEGSAPPFCRYLSPICPKRPCIHLTCNGVIGVRLRCSPRNEAFHLGSVAVGHGCCSSRIELSAIFAWLHRKVGGRGVGGGAFSKGLITDLCGTVLGAAY